jgi:hypothetical protein
VFVQAVAGRAVSLGAATQEDAQRLGGVRRCESGREQQTQ